MFSYEGKEVLVQKSISLKNRLIYVDDSVLVVIDFQDSFLKKYRKEIGEPLIINM
jgi:hypothetical protein